jgi:hypothetical protein
MTAGMPDRIVDTRRPIEKKTSKKSISPFNSCNPFNPVNPVKVGPGRSFRIPNFPTLVILP